jgi:hypothetical protein
MKPGDVDLAIGEESRPWSIWLISGGDPKKSMPRVDEIMLLNSDDEDKARA